MPDHTQEDWDSNEESGHEDETHSEVEDRTANVEEDQSDCSEEVVGEGDEADVMQDLLLVPQRRTMSEVFASLDCVNLEEVFQVRAVVMKTVPMFMSGAFRAALKVGLEGIRRGQSTGNEEVSTRGWKLFLLLPRMWRPCSTTQVGRTFGTIQQWGVRHTGRKST